MKNNKEFKRLQCNLSVEVFDKLKQEAQKRRISIGKYLDTLLSCIDHSFTHTSLVTFEFDRISKEKVDNQPWWKKLFR